GLPAADEGDVEVVAGEVEVVGVAAEARDGNFGREREPHVEEPLVFIQTILSAMVELDHVAADLVAAAGTLLLDAGHGPFALVVELLARLEPLGRALHLRSDVGDLRQLVDLDLRALDLVFGPRGVEALGDEVLLL